MLNSSILKIQGERYLLFLTLLVPSLNFLSGTSIDLYAPSMPAISAYFHVSVMAVKNTVSITFLGFAIGSLFFGILFDVFGRRRIILFGLGVFFLASLIAAQSHSMAVLMCARFFQGMMVSTVSVGSRALVFDHFSGKRYAILMLYLSLAYASGPVLGPFIGGIIQYHLGWRANFYAYAVFSGALWLLALFFLDESLKSPLPFSLGEAIKQYSKVFSHPVFIVGVLILVGGMLEQVIYPVLGPFIVQNVLQRSSLVYGNTALFVACGYLLGTLTNRAIIHAFSARTLARVGFVVMIFGAIFQVVLATCSNLNLVSLTLPIMVICFSLGFIFPNILGACLRLFPESPGVASAVQVFCLTAMSALGTLTISHFNVVHLSSVAWIYAVIICIQLFLFFGYFRKVLV